MTRVSPPNVLWQCPPERLASAPLTRYCDWLRRERGLRFTDYNQLWEWSVAEIETFWESIWHFCGVRAGRPYHQVLDQRTMPGARWFEGAELNFAAHCLPSQPGDEVALVHASELRELQEWTTGELRSRTARIAGGLRELGVQRGDRVAAYLPNLPEAVAAFLACASIGAIWSSCSPDFGAPAVIDRFRQIAPKVLLAVDGYRYGGRNFDRAPVLDALRRELPTVDHVIVLNYLRDTDGQEQLNDAISWRRLEEMGAGYELKFANLPFDHPLWILYSSGTTGLPKPIVHGHGGILLEQLKLQHLQFDLRPNDRFFWFSTTGWVMWNVLVSALLTRAAIVLYDGSPAYPDHSHLWSIARDAGATCFGASAAYLTACMRRGAGPVAGRSQPIRSIGSTGSPLPPEVFRWVYQHFPPETWLLSVSGGTDVAGAFVGGAISVPVYEGEISARMLGVSVESWDEAGRSLTDATGELVVTEPMPSMPLFLWGDTDGTRLHESYFNTFPGVWRHGDWIEITSRGTSIVRGRSDSTINRGGVRMGTSEIYRTVLSLPYVVDAIAVDVPLEATYGFIWLFVVLDAGAVLDDAARSEIKERIRASCSPRHVPDEIVQAPDVPRTISGKIIEVPIKRILMGEPADQAVSRGSLANPEALKWFVSYAGAVARRGEVRPRSEISGGGPARG